MRRIDTKSNGKLKYADMHTTFNECEKETLATCKKEAAALVKSNPNATVPELSKLLQERFMLDDKPLTGDSKDGDNLIPMLNGRDAKAAILEARGEVETTNGLKENPVFTPKESEEQKPQKLNKKICAKCIKEMETIVDKNSPKRVKLVSAEIQQHHFPLTPINEIEQYVKTKLS